MNHKRATIIFNPMSGRPARRAEDVRRMIALLGERGVDAQAHATAGPGDATKLAEEAVAAGADIMISYGGDGTLNEVIQGMAGSQTALAVWPGGTSNVVARDLGTPFEIRGLADMIAGGKTRRIALGLVLGNGGQGLGIGRNGSERQPPTPSPQPLRRYFLMMAGIGLDASIARGVNKKLKRRTGEFAYWLSGIRHLFLWRAEPFTVEVDGRNLPVHKHRVEHLAAIVDRDITLDLDLPGLAIDLDLNDVSPKRKREVRGLKKVRSRKAWFKSGWYLMRDVRRKRHFLNRDALGGAPLFAGIAVATRGRHRCFHTEASFFECDSRRIRSE